MKAILSTIAAGAAIVAATPIAYNNAGESQLEKRCSPFDTTPTIYANSSSISYSEGTNWHLITTNYGFDKEGVEAYSGDACADYVFDGGILQFAYGFTIYCGKKDDRGYFDVYVGEEYAGRGDAYDGSCKDKCKEQAVFTYSLKQEQMGKPITVRNRKSDSRLDGRTPYLDLGYLTIDPDNC